MNHEKPGEEQEARTAEHVVPPRPDPIGNDLRRERPRRGLPEDAACMICGETDPVALRRVRRRSLLERHHVAGEANDTELVVILCRTHHSILTSDQPGVGVALAHDPKRTLPEKVISVLRGLAQLFYLAARTLGGWADKLAAWVAELDAHFPRWRELPAAQA